MQPNSGLNKDRRFRPHNLDLFQCVAKSLERLVLAHVQIRPQAIEDGFVWQWMFLFAPYFAEARHDSVMDVVAPSVKVLHFWPSILDLADALTPELYGPQ
jgi:hypothetical protein